jgi:hypothetical protein
LNLLLGFLVTLFAPPLFSQFVFESIQPIQTSEAKKVDLDLIAKELWPFAVEGTSEGLTVRMAISKFEVKRGEPLDLLIYLVNDSKSAIRLPKIHPIAFLKMNVLTISGQQVPSTPMGEWFKEEYRMSLDACGAKHLPVGTIRVIHSDVTQLVDISEPGEYVVTPHCVFFSAFMTGLPQRAYFPGMRFRVLNEPYEGGKERPISFLQASYNQYLLEKATPPQPSPAPEGELSPETRAIFKEAGRKAHERWEAEQASSTSSPPTQTAPIATELPFSRLRNTSINLDSSIAAPQKVGVQRPSHYPILAVIVRVFIFVLWLALRRF